MRSVVARLAMAVIAAGYLRTARLGRSPDWAPEPAPRRKPAYAGRRQGRHIVAKLRHLAIATDDPDGTAQFYIDAFELCGYGRRAGSSPGTSCPMEPSIWPSSISAPMKQRGSRRAPGIGVCTTSASRSKMSTTPPNGYRLRAAGPEPISTTPSALLTTARSRASSNTRGPTVSSSTSANPGCGNWPDGRRHRLGRSPAHHPDREGSAVFGGVRRCRRLTAAAPTPET